MAIGTKMNSILPATQASSYETREITGCEVCGNRQLTSVLRLGSQPMCDDLVAVGDERRCREYPIEILLCDVCVTAHQRFQVEKRRLFPSAYHYRSRFTVDVLNGMKQLVQKCETKYGSLAGKKVLDVGCNDGSLLDFFRERGATTLGVEPTSAVKDAERKGHLTYETYLSDDVADKIVARHGTPDLVTFTNVFAHIEDLHAVLASLRRLMRPDTVLVIENHYLGAVLHGNQFDTFYHEHLRTYSCISFVHIARALDVGLLDVEFPARYGGNIRVFLGRTVADGMTEKQLDELLARERQFPGMFEMLRKNIVRWQRTKGQFLKDLVARHGKIRAKAFPGRAAILLNLLGLDTDTISAVYEKPGSMKIGHYLPGTRVPVRSDDELFSLPDKSQPLLNLAWHIPQEIRQYMAERGYTGPIIDVVGAEDFSQAG
jgi:SAM-dependent methyltransferase